MKIKEFLMLNIMPFVIANALRLIGLTLRLSETGNILLSPKQKKGPSLFVFWHSRILASVYYYRNRNIHTLVSLNRDGEFINRVMRKLGYTNIRGSTSKDGFRALLGLKQVLNNGNYVAITPDGPRGPKQKVQPGVITLSKISGVPLTTFAFDAKRKWVLNSWDNFIIPKPFTKGVFVLGKEIIVPADSNGRVLEEKRLELEEELSRLQEEAGRLCQSR
ncbi:MAG: lysophospholipid acyltransferase family protein [Candidatus Firestonebacteria bacterium]